MKDQPDVIYEYTLNQAIADGVLTEVFKSRWLMLSGGKAIVATAAVFGDISLAGLIEIWNEFVPSRSGPTPSPAGKMSVTAS